MDIKYDVINSRKYFSILSKHEITEEEEIKIKAFEEFMSRADKYRDYLIGSLKNNKDNYEKEINRLAVQETTNPEIALTNNEKRAIEAYNQAKSNELASKENKIRRLEKSAEVSAGYTNSFVLILSVLATGILMGVVLFLIK